MAVAGSPGLGFNDLAPNAGEAALLPVSAFWGTVSPQLLWLLPAPNVLSYSQKELIVAAWQLFPYSSVILQQILVRLLPSLLSHPKWESATLRIWALRWTYSFTFLTTVLPRTTAMSISIGAAILPTLFAPELVDSIKPDRVFLPVAFTGSTAMPSVLEGSLLMFQWDQWLGSITTLLWAIVTLVSHLEAAAVNRRQYAGKIVQVFAIGVASLVVGPVGCATLLFWARDEFAYTRLLETKRLKMQ
jgi:hypothetical protein